MERSPSRQYIGLDVVRFAAALSVVFYHLAFWWWLPSVSGSPTAPIAVEPFRWGWVGVPVFFVLSGFVIAFSAEGKTVGQFVAGRALRLYPAAWICATVTLAVARIGTGGAEADYARSLVLSPVGPWISGVYWTLAVEIVFYAAVAAALAMRWRLTALAALLGFASAGYWLLRAADFATGGHFKALFAAVEGPLGGLTLLPYGCYFAIGMALWALVGGYRRDMLALIACSVAGALVALTAGARFYLSSQGGAASHVVEAPLIWLAALAAIIASIHWRDAIWRRWGHMGGQVRTIGLMTYPLYLVHSEVGRLLALRLGQSIGAVLVAVAATVLLALVVTELEQYPRALVKSAFRMRRPTVAASDLP